jgi:hypothetical protein
MSIRSLGMAVSSLLMLGVVMASPVAAQPGAPAPAGVKDKEVVKAAQFAVKAASKDGAKVTLVKVLSAKTQVVAGINYILTLQVKQGKKVRTAKTVVWEQAWRKVPYELTSWKFTDEKDEPKPKPDKDADKSTK